MAGNPKLRPGVDPEKFSRCRSRSEDGTDPLESAPIPGKSNRYSISKFITVKVLVNTFYTINLEEPGPLVFK